MSLLRLALISVMVATPALAQYAFDPNNSDEQEPGVRFFGSAKDEEGALIPNVAVLVARYFVLVTDKQGRYRGNINSGVSVADTTIVCSKPGYEFVRVAKRPGPAKAAKQTLEANCVLRKK